MCGALPAEAGAVAEARADAVIRGSVIRDGNVLEGAYVRLLDAAGEFTAEVRTDVDGRFRFFAAPGDWLLRTLAPGAGKAETLVTVPAGGQAAPVRVVLG